MINRTGQLADFVTATNGESCGQVTAGDFPDMGNDTGQRIKQGMTDAVPDHHQNQHQHDGQHAKLPLGEMVIPRALIKCLDVKLFANAGVLAQRLAERVLHSLRRLREVGVHIAAFQKLNQFCQGRMVLLIFFLNVAAGFCHFRQRCDVFKFCVMRFSLRQRCFRILQQIVFSAALLVRRIHHHARRRTA